MLVGDVLPGVNEYRVIVRVNGVVRAVEGVSWSTGMAGDLPDQVIASGGLGGASGTISWAPQSAVQSRPVSPWAKVANWPPTAGDLVQVQVTDGETTWTRFTGVIDKTTGSAGGGYQSSIIDFRDRVTGSFTHEALLRYMPPQVEDGSYRRIGLNFWYPLTMALRSTGFYNVPPIEPYSEVSVPLQGSVWPEAGTVRDTDGSGGTAHASFFRTDFGYAAGSFTAEYSPRLRAPASDPLQVTLVVPSTHSGTGVVDVVYGGRTVRLRVNTGRGVTAFFSPNGTSPWTTVASLSMGDADTVTLLVKGGLWTLRTNTTGVATGTQALGSGDLSTITLTGDAGARLAGLQVSHPNSSSREFASLDFSPSMRFEPSGLASTMDMMPALRGRSINDLVNEILEATLTASWWDETGTLILRPSNLLRGTASSQTVTTSTDITSLAWEDSLLAVRSAVEVKWKSPSVSKGRQYRLELWRGPAETLTGADEIQHFVTPDSGTEWFGVDRTFRELGDANWGAYNDRRGSYLGIWYSNSAGDELSTNDGSVHWLSENTYSDSMIVSTNTISLPSGVEANTSTSPSASALKPYLRGQPLPVVRGMGRGEWVDATYRVSAGSSSAQVLQHDLGYWGGEYFEGGSVAQRIGDYLAGQVSAPQPTIPGLGVIYDPRRQVGDVYTIRSEWLGIELRVLVTDISEDHGSGSHQSLTVRVISATNIRPVTYDDLAAAWGTGNYAGLQAAWAALNYTALAANPLEGAPS